MNDQLLLWPPSASDYSGRLDTLLISLTVLIALLAGPVFILIAAFAFRYRRGRKTDRSHASNRNIWLEISWAAVPFVLLLIFYFWSIDMFVEAHSPPRGAMEIAVVGKQWMWKFQHPTGQREINDLHVPTGTPIKLVMTSEDVIHSLFLPALRLKQDVLPGRYTSFWFNADRPGTYRLACTQFCGTDHSVMGGSLVVLTQGDYADWLAANQQDTPLVGQGKRLFARLGCGACHSASARAPAPDLAGLYGQPVTLADGSSVTADDQYLHDSIVLPNAQVVAGYQPIMPSYQNTVSEEDVVKLVAYIRSLAPAPAGARP